jgi:hypothetical protein
MIAIVQFIQIFQLLNSKNYSSIPFGYLKFTHIPDITLVGVILFLVFIILVYLYRIKHGNISESAYFVFILVVSCFVTRNEHILSGMIMQYSHFEMYQFGPVAVISTLFFISHLTNKLFVHKLNYMIPVLIVLFFINSILIQNESYLRFKNYLDTERIRGPLFEWINKNLPEGSVFAGSRDIMNLMTVYTNNYVIWDYFAGEWMSLPDRSKDFEVSRRETKNLEIIGNRYGVDYYIEEKSNNLLINSSKRILYEDDNFIIYDKY